MTVFMTADPHFGHERIIELCARPFADVDEMNSAMLDNFNRVASSDDMIVFLGDVVMGKFDANIELISQIRAKTTIVAGNHDRISRAYQRKGDVEAKILKMSEKYLEYFDIVLVDTQDGDPHRISFGGYEFVMSHYPFTGDHGDKDRFPELRPKDQGIPLLHGHVHELWKFKDRMFNVGVDVNDFQLVTEEEILKWRSTL